MRTNSLVFLTCVLLVAGVAAAVFGIFQVMSKVDRAIEGKNRLSVHMQHDTEARIMEQPTCIKKTFPKCDNIEVAWYQRPGESFEQFVQRVKDECKILEENWGN